jgi:hypothetical protein
MLWGQCKDPRTVEKGAEMVKFLCDSCGKDISEKVHDSVKQFCGKDYFGQSKTQRVAGNQSKRLPHAQHGADDDKEPVYLEVQLLHELSRLIQGTAWGIPTNAMNCSDCAMADPEQERVKVITIFTRVSHHHYAC